MPRRDRLGPTQALVWINVILGGAVLASYAWGLARIPKPSMLWGGAPRWIRIGAFSTMPLAAAGHLWIVWGHLIAQMDLDEAMIFGRPAGWLIVSGNALLLLASTAWMPLTVASIEAPSKGRKMAVITVLWITASITILMAPMLYMLESNAPGWSRNLAIVGLAGFGSNP